MKPSQDFQEHKRLNPYKQVKEELHASICSHGHFQFSDNRWYYSKWHVTSQTKNYFVVNFKKVPVNYRSTMKYYALMLSISPHKVQEKIYKIADFLIMLEKKFASMPLTKVTYKEIQAYEQWLNLGDQTSTVNYFAYNSLQEFFTCLLDLGEAPKILPMKQINPFTRLPTKRARRYIPKDSVMKLDHYFKNESSPLPLEFRLLYWLMRSYPNRINELLSMNEDCLTQEQGMYLLHVPTYKQNGGYTRPEMKQIPILYEGHGKYLIDLFTQWKLVRQQIIAHHLPYRLHQFKENALFISTFWKFEEVEGRLEVVPVTGFGFNDKIKNLSLRAINLRLAELSSYFQLQDEEGKPLKITTHYFRHNAITDRLYTTHYTSEQVQKLTGHKNEKMAYYYTHPQKERHQQVNETLQMEESGEFMGKILSFNQFTIHQLTKNQEAYGVSDMVTEKGIGVCSSMAYCRPDGIPDRFSCYYCEWFVPKVAFKGQYIKEYDYWESIINQLNVQGLELSEKNQKKLAQALSISERLTNLIQKLDGTLMETKKEYIEQLESGEINDKD